MHAFEIDSTLFIIHSPHPVVFAGHQDMTNIHLHASASWILLISVFLTNVWLGTIVSEFVRLKKD